MAKPRKGHINITCPVCEGRRFYKIPDERLKGLTKKDLKLYTKIGSGYYQSCSKCGGEGIISIMDQEDLKE